MLILADIIIFLVIKLIETLLSGSPNYRSRDLNFFLWGFKWAAPPKERAGGDAPCKLAAINQIRQLGASPRPPRPAAPLTGSRGVPPPLQRALPSLGFVSNPGGQESPRWGGGESGVPPRPPPWTVLFLNPEPRWGRRGAGRVSAFRGVGSACGAACVGLRAGPGERRIAP